MSVTLCVKTFKLLVEYVTDHDTRQDFPQAQIYSTFDFDDGSYMTADLCAKITLCFFRVLGGYTLYFVV